MKRSAIEVLREASRHVPNEIYVEVDAAIDAAAELFTAASVTLDEPWEIDRLRSALARFGGAK